MIEIVENNPIFYDELFMIEDSALMQSDKMSKASFMAEFDEKSRKYFVAKDGSTPIGYIGLFDCVDSMEIISFAVKKECQNKGIGTKLLQKATQFATLNKKDALCLEVNSNNLNAIKFYKKNGFETLSTRKNYYKDADALVMQKNLQI